MNETDFTSVRVDLVIIAVICVVFLVSMDKLFHRLLGSCPLHVRFFFVRFIDMTISLLVCAHVFLLKPLLKKEINTKTITNGV